MKRRDLLKILSLGGVATVLPLSWSRRSQAADQRLWIMVQAPGAWDPVSFCNPHTNSEFYLKGAVPSATPMSHYTAESVGQAGNIRYVKELAPGFATGFDSFAEKYYRDLLVINGIESNNGNHVTGVRICVCGDSALTHPTFAAYAVADNPKLPLQVLIGDGYENTAGLVSKVPLMGLSSLPSLWTQTPTVFDPQELTLLQNARLQRLQTQQQASRLPREALEQQASYDAWLTVDELKKLTSALPADLSTDPTENALQHLCAAMAAGLTGSAQLGIRTETSWDTHSNHDAGMSVNLLKLFASLDFLLMEAERQGLRDRLNIVVSSDFGRTPFFNSGQGKDHWSVGSMLFIGPDFDGNRVVKLDNEFLEARPVNPATLEPSATGEIITMKHVFRSLRSLVGPLDTGLDQRFPLTAPPVPKLFRV